MTLTAERQSGFWIRWINLCQEPAQYRVQNKFALFILNSFTLMHSGADHQAWIHDGLSTIAQKHASVQTGVRPTTAPLYKQACVQQACVQQAHPTGASNRCASNRCVQQVRPTCVRPTGKNTPLYKQVCVQLQRLRPDSFTCPERFFEVLVRVRKLKVCIKAYCLTSID